MKVNSKRKERCKRVYEFYMENIYLGKSYRVKLYLAEKIPKISFMTLFDVLKTILVIEKRLEVVV